MSSSKKSFSLKQKVEILNKFDSRGALSITDFAKSENLNESTVRTFVRKRKEIEESARSTSCKRQRIREGKFKSIEDSLLQWFYQARASSIPISGPILKEKAKEISQKISVTDFRASNGWLDRFRIRHGIVYRQICGEAKSVNMDDVNLWLNTTLPSILENYDPKDVYNADECALFYKLLPDRSFVLQGETCQGGKCSKERLTVLLSCNATGTHKLEPLVIGKSKNPRCFKSIKKLPCRYTHQSRAWMTADCFRSWLASVNSEMMKRNRNILMFIDNCPAHPKGLRFSNIRVEFLPPNSTSCLQPLDQGIIKVVKHYYRKKLVLRYIAAVDSGQSPQPITVLDAMQNITAAWHNITRETAANCFRKSGMQCTAMEHDNLVLEDNILGVNMVEYSSIDDQVVICSSLTLDEIIETVTEPSTQVEEEDDEDNDAEIVSTCPKISDALLAISTLQTYLSTDPSNSSNWSSTLYSLENAVLHSVGKTYKQSTIDNFLMQIQNVPQ